MEATGEEVTTMTKPAAQVIRKDGSTIWFHTQTLEITRNGEPPWARNRPLPISRESVFLNPVLPASLILTLTDACNLRCRYCFEQELGSARARRTMSPDMAKQAIDFYLSLPHNPESTIILFGGEPMLWWKHIPDLVQYGNTRATAGNTRITWGISTNGTVFPEYAMDFFVNHGISPVINIDGDRITHDSLRPFAGGGGSYEIILTNFLAFRRKEGSHVTLRATVTPDHPHLFQVYQLFSDLHPDEIAIFPQYFSSGSDRWDEPALQILLDEFEKLADYSVSQILNGSCRRPPPFPFSAFIPHLCARERKLGYCGAYGPMIAVAPDGKIYPCMTLDGHQSWCIGDLSRGFDHETHDRWKRLSNNDNRSGCRDCWAWNLCGGGCICHTVLMSGENAPPAEFECRIIRHIIELSIWMYSEILEKKPDYFLYLIPKRAR